MPDQGAGGGLLVRGLRGGGARKLSCLSPIVEHVGGRDSALGTSNSGTGSGSNETDR